MYLRSLLSSLGGARFLRAHAPRFTASEVRWLLTLRESPRGARQEAVLDAAAIPGLWEHRLKAHTRWELGRLADRLPTIVALDASGVSSAEIAGHVGAWSAWEASTALDVACGCIAAALNASPARPAVAGSADASRGRREAP